MKRKPESEKNTSNKRKSPEYKLLQIIITPDANDEEVVSPTPPKVVIDCPNPDCDHQDNSEKVIPITLEKNKKITLTDLIDLGKSYHCKCQSSYHGVNLKSLCKLIKPLTELKHMIGLTSIKEKLVEQIVYFVQGYDHITADMLHTIITGPPGVGKTELSKIIAKIYCALNILPSSKMVYARRSDLVGQYLGETAIKTQKKIDEADGGVLLIDEAYSLGNPEKRDSFSKECIDTLNQNLTDKKGKFVCIIVGYADSLDTCFFAHNSGLKRRFTFKYDIEGYTSEELHKILHYKLGLIDYTMDKINKKLDMPFFGGDIESLVLHLKIVHSNRVFMQEDMEKKKITEDDLEAGLKRLNDFRKPKEDKIPDFVKHLYT